jgi:hypothetical protein
LAAVEVMTVFSQLPGCQAAGTLGGGGQGHW